MSPTPKPDSAAARPAPTLAALAAMFLVSGATGLVYEVVWFRLLFLRLGGTGLAVATVTAAFMAGLGLGAWLFGTRLARRVPPIRLYALLEGFIGLYALAVPFLVDIAGSLDSLLLGSESAGTPVRLVRFLLAGAVLLPPTIAMGGTLPALSRLVESDPRRPGRFVGLLYGLNTTGAVAGAYAAGFLLLPSLGFLRSVLAAAAANLALALAALALSASRGERAAPAASSSPPSDRHTPATAVAAQPRLALMVYTASGLTAFMLQVAWTRILSLVVASSIYSFSFILSVFLAGLGLGALLSAPLLDRAGSPRRALAWTFLVAGAGALLGQGLYGLLPGLFLRGLAETDHGLALRHVLTLAGITMLPATLALGAGFPLAVRLATGDQRAGVAALVGRLYAANTTGSVLGAFLTALVLIPALGLYGVVSLAGGLALAVAALLAAGAGHGRRSRPAWMPLAGTVVVLALWMSVVPGWNKPLMSESVAFWRDTLAKDPDSAWQRLATLRAGGGPELIYYRDGVTATVAVKEERFEGAPSSRFMTIDGKIDASSVLDMPQQVMLAHLPLLAVKASNPDVLLIGHASGITAGSVLTYPVASLVLAEIEQEVFEASHLFDEISNAPLDDSRVQVVADDARAYLQRTDRSFDIITSSPSSAWLGGNAKLWTREYFALASSRLRPGGLICQYIQAYDIDEETFFTMLRTAGSEFQYVAVLKVDAITMLLLASNEPMQFAPVRLAEAVSSPGTGRDLARAHITSPCHILELVVAEPAAIAAAVGEGPVNDDDNALVEFRGPEGLGLTIVQHVEPLLRRQARGAAAMLSGLAPDGPIDAASLAQTCLQARAPGAAASLALHSLDQGADPRALWVLGEVRRDQSRRTEALGYFEEAASLAPGDDRILISHALTLKELGRLDESLAAWDQALAAISGGARPLALAGRGQTRLLAGDPAGAVADLFAASASGALPPALAVDLGQALIAVDRAAEARPYLEAFIVGRGGGDTMAGTAARQMLAGLLGAAGAPAERTTRLLEEAAAARARVVPGVLGQARRRLRTDGAAAAGSYLREQAGRDPGLAAALVETLHAEPEPEPELVRLVESLPGS